MRSFRIPKWEGAERQIGAQAFDILNHPNSISRWATSTTHSSAIASAPSRRRPAFSVRSWAQMPPRGRFRFEPNSPSSGNLRAPATQPGPPPGRFFYRLTILLPLDPPSPQISPCADTSPRARSACDWGEFVGSGWRVRQLQPRFQPIGGEMKTFFRRRFGG